MDIQSVLTFDSQRRFGVEIELNAFDDRDFRENPLAPGELPEGIHYIAWIIAKKSKKNVLIQRWDHTHNNDYWVLKPDSSCGIEICSPVSRGTYGIHQICHVVDTLQDNRFAVADDRCSLHVHIEVKDCSVEEIAKILAYWIKCEAVFLDSVSFVRKNNQFCQCIGQNQDIKHNDVYDPVRLITRLGSHKYFTANAYQMMQKGKRKTLEFRIMGREGCFDSFLVKNWLRLLLHFVDCAKKAPSIYQYVKGDPWSSLLWLDLRDVLKFLGFWEDRELSSEMRQTRNWFVDRVKENWRTTCEHGIWSLDARKIVSHEIDCVMQQFGLEKQFAHEFLCPIDRRVDVRGG